MSDEDFVADPSDHDYSGFRITGLWAFTTIGEDNEEGVVAFQGRDGMWMPLVASDAVRVDQLRQVAQEMADQRGITIQVSHFHLRTDLEVIEPRDTPPR